MWKILKQIGDIIYTGYAETQRFGLTKILSDTQKRDIDNLPPDGRKAFDSQGRLDSSDLIITEYIKGTETYAGRPVNDDDYEQYSFIWPSRFSAVAIKKD